MIALSVGGADRALRIAMDFARDRTLFGKRLIDTPVTRLQLTNAFADLLAADILVAVAARALHHTPERLNLYAAISKFAVPTLADEMMASLSIVLGTRYYLRRGLSNGLFQKLLRDISMVNFVDGNTLVNLKVIGLQMEFAFRHLATIKKAEQALGAADMQTLERLFDLGHDVPAAEFAKLRVFCGSKDIVLCGLEDTLEHLANNTDLDAATP